ncbi:inner membrane CreD family protein, partial [Desulfobacterales bacterium HSG17]|nr:inner membrane CreD family protein [Desulfobacterales bacterium HSG17]
IFIVFFIACAGWWILGTTTGFRSNEYYYKLGPQVENLWGSSLIQQAPAFAVEIPGSKQVRWLMPSKNDIQVILTPDYRKKGLIWYSTYICSFNGKYTITGNESVTQKVRLYYNFPAKGATYDDFGIFLDDNPLGVSVNTSEGIGYIIELKPGESKTFRVKYKTRGLDLWVYKTDQNVGRVQNLNLTAKTGFRNVDYTRTSLSPMSAEQSVEGMVLTWQAKDLITNADMGIVIPEKINPGPLTSRITYFAPVCLLFFFVLIATINIMYKIDIHPMHYLFVAAGFFAFHLLLSYLAGLVHIHISFILSAIISLGLVTGYLRAALGKEFPWKAALAGQVFFLILFSYSFFLKGMTGLAVAIGSVVTLAVLMKVTAHVNWDEVFSKQINLKKADQAAKI